MKKTKSSAKKKSVKKKISDSNNGSSGSPNEKFLQKKQDTQKSVPISRKKTMDKKGSAAGPALNFISIARHFLREAKIELKKVKWPTKKELIASTAVVIFISFFMAFYFWLVDMGLMAIIRNFFT